MISGPTTCRPRPFAPVQGGARQPRSGGEIAEYERLSSGKVSTFTASTLGGLAALLIRAGSVRLMFVLDTNIVSELRKVRSGKADPGVAEWAAGVPSAEMFVSAITIHELEHGVLLMERSDLDQGALLRSWLDESVAVAFADRVLAVDEVMARRAASLHVPNPAPYRDAHRRHRARPSDDRRDTQHRGLRAVRRSPSPQSLDRRPKSRRLRQSARYLIFRVLESRDGLRLDDASGRVEDG